MLSTQYIRSYLKCPSIDEVLSSHFTWRSVPCFDLMSFLTNYDRTCELYANVGIFGILA